mgnify:CR=1 FL=1
MTAAVALTASPLLAAGTITSGPFTVGIGANGELFDFGSYIGFQRNADSYDPLSPGTPRDSWGISTAGGSAYGDQSYYGSLNITGVAFTEAWGGATQTALISTSIGASIKMKYSFAAPNVLKVKHSVTGVSGYLFQRNWDLDVSPTFFYENSTGIWYPVPVVEDSYYGFEDPDPAVPYAFPCGPTCNAVGDLGGGIKIAPKGSFTYCYAISDEGQSMLGLIEQAFKLGCRHMVATQSMENGIFPSLGENSALIGITIPEPGTWAMLIAGFGLVGWTARRRREAVTA